MKILFVVSPGAGTRMGFGGAQIHVRDLARGLSELGHQVMVATNHSTSVVELYKDESFGFVDLPDLVRPISPRHDFRTVTQLRSIVREFKPDIVSLHSSKPGVVGRLAMLGMPVKVIFTAHGWAFTDGVSRRSRLFYTAIEFVSQFMCDKIVTVSEFDHQLAANAWFSKRKLQTIHNGMPDTMDKLAADLKHEKQPDSQMATNGKQLLTIARFSGQKDYETLFSALALMKHKDSHLIAIGGGDAEQTSKWRERAAALGLSDRVSILGEIKNVYPYFRDSQVYVLSSNWEGLPRSIIEAMMMKLPVVATEVGGNRELIDDNNTGFLIDRNNAQGMADKLDYLLDHPVEATEMGQRARGRYESLFRFRSMFKKHLNLYRTLTGLSALEDDREASRVDTKHCSVEKGIGASLAGSRARQPRTDSVVDEEVVQ